MTDATYWDTRYADSATVWSGNANAALVAEAGVTVDFQQHDLGASFPAGHYDLVSTQFLYPGCW